MCARAQFSIRNFTCYVTPLSNPWSVTCDSERANHSPRFTREVEAIADCSHQERELSRRGCSVQYSNSNPLGSSTRRLEPDLLATTREDGSARDHQRGCRSLAYPAPPHLPGGGRLDRRGRRRLPRGDCRRPNAVAMLPEPERWPSRSPWTAARYPAPKIFGEGRANQPLMHSGSTKVSIISIEPPIAWKTVRATALSLVST